MPSVGHARESSRFFIALAALTAIFVIGGILGFYGLRSVDRAGRQIYDDNFQTAQTTSRLSADLGRAQSTSLEVLATDRLVEAERLRAELAQSLVPSVDSDIKALLRIHADDPPEELSQIKKIPVAWESFRALAHAGVLEPGSGAVMPSRRTSEAHRVEHSLNPLIAFVNGRQRIEVEAAAEAHASAQSVYERSRAWLIVSAVLALVAIFVLVRAGLTLRGLLAEQARERRHGQSASEFIDVLQGTGSEEEAQELLRRHLERTNPDSLAVVLVRNNSDDRLEARTSLEELTRLQEPLMNAAPRSCLAVRFARGHSEAPDREPLVSCELCGKLPGSSLCEPLLVGGEVIGSVLLTQQHEPEPDACRRMRESVAQAAPVLGNLRNLALAERRAATDALTGLPNRRGVQDTLKRMVAQASRTISPLSAVLVDLDHFKRINDLYGHDRGDELLAAVGVVLRNAVRDSDFAGRYGGEEFLILLPSSDRQSAVRVAETVRGAIAAISIPGVEQAVTASAGVAVLPDDGGDAVTLLRATDRALYAAKNAGRDQVFAAGDGSSGDSTRAAASSTPA